ncbi:HWE histidine kinase domain-containing protein [Rhizobium sp. S163]|uniref:sensor histidine kinase n=1 Tax=Rhizobium sp. S163 TaxID=3055039 RepID=UPI0025AA00E1|nr:HWE histidine kinase domain-containing protein [Rhizobium sp. S163]MDM9644863.1 HWE histidine kinase domain-containing protein [Rhizobium sp. S163]
MNTHENARELRRLQALDEYAILDTPNEKDFDDVARLASDICGTPIAVVNLIGDRRQFFKAEVGLGVRETPFESSFCAKAILENDFLMVPDATKDKRFDCNPLVTGEPHLRFYAGAILKNSEGLPLGTVCVLDYEPRELNELQQRTLRVLASQVMAQLELRRVAASEADARRAESEEKARYKAVFNSAIDYAIIVMDRSGLITDWNDGATRVLGWERSEATGRDVSFVFTPEDREAGVPDLEMRSARTQGRGIDERWHLRKSGERFWANGELMPLTADEGALQGYVKILRDQTVERLQEQRKQLLLEEMAHRVKNSFAVVQAVASQSLREIDPAIASTFQDRIIALGRAHDLLLQTNWQSTHLRALLDGVLLTDTFPGRFEIDGPDIVVGSKTSMSLSLLLHEMATNALKYGALSVIDGKVEIRWTLEDDGLQLTWREIGGPSAAAPLRKGFGSKLIAMGINGARDVALDFGSGGLTASFRAPAATLST